MGIPQIEGPAVAPSYDPACFTDQQDARSHVPGMDMGCPEGIERTGGDMSKVKSGRAGTADGLRYLDGFNEVQQVSRVPPDVCWQADRDERFSDNGDAAGF